MYHTLLNEHRKNLAIFDAAKKHSHQNKVGGDDMGPGFVKSVVGLFSIEIAFNSHEGHTVHGDAVHLGVSNDGNHVLKAVMNRFIDTICYMDKDREELILLETQ